MRVEELRIGNYITNKYDELVQVDGISFYGEVIIESDTSDDGYYEILTLDCEPIPLTEEWLLKFGFKKLAYTDRIFYKGNYGVDLGIEYYFVEKKIVGR